MKNKYPNKEFTKNIIEKIYQKSEEAKVALSSSTSCDIIIESNNESEDLKISLTREKFYEISNHLFERCILPIEKVLKSPNFNRNDIDSLILVGGSTYIPKIHDISKKKKKSKNVYIEQQNQNETFEENEFQEKKNKKKCLIC